MITQSSPVAALSRAAVVLCAGAWLLQTGCQSVPGCAYIVTPAELGATQARALESGRLVIALIIDPANGAMDNSARAEFLSRRAARTADRGVLLAMLDLSDSRTRATAARFHPVQTPLLLCLSPHGVITSRDQAPITESLILERMRQAPAQSSELDAKLEQLQSAARGTTNGAQAQMQLADFLVEQGNAAEAVPVLATVAHSDTVDSALRIRAWAALAGAHTWIGEAEKGRFEAQALMATLGPANPDARAAGYLVLGNQDATNAKRFARARREFQEAISAAPDSTYGKQAEAALAGLPRGGP